MSRIRILATSDVHGYIYPYSYANKKEENIGLARVSTLINKLRDENTILIDNGDNLEGSPLMYYHMHGSKFTSFPVAQALNYIGYDYVNIGNHDYNYGEETLNNYLAQLKAKCITCNVLYNNNPLVNYSIREIAGKKIAIFGLTTQYIPNWEKGEHIKNSCFIDAYKCCKDMVEKIRQKENPDYLICVYHGGFERDLTTGEPSETLTLENEGYQILKDINGIDVLISGHQHRSLSGKLFDKVYTQTKDKGSELALIDIDTDSNTIESKVIEASDDADINLMKLIKEEEDACQKWLDIPLGESKVDLKVTNEDDARLHKSQVITFLNKVALDFTKADLSANALFDKATGFNKYITMRDLVSTYVYPNTMVVKKVNGKMLKEYLEKCAEFFDIKDDEIVISDAYLYPKPLKFNYDMIDGVEYTIKVSNEIGKRITSLKRNGKDIKEDDEFTICVNNYRASGGGDFMMIKNAETVKEYADGMVDLLADYISSHKVIDFKPVNNIVVEK